MNSTCKNSILFLFLLWGMISVPSCQGEPEKEKEKEIHVAPAQALNRLSYEKREGGGIRFFKDEKENIYASWVEKNDTTLMFTLWAATFNEATDSFENKFEIRSTAGLQFFPDAMPKIAVKKDGTWVMVYARMMGVGEENPFEIAWYRISKDDGKTWSEEVPIHPDTSGKYSHEFSDIALLPNGEIGLTCLVHEGGMENRGSQLVFATTSPGKGFGKYKVLDEMSCECCKTDIEVSDSGTVYIAYRKIAEDSTRNTHVFLSSDNGGKFAGPYRFGSEHWNINACPVSGATLAPFSNSFTHLAVYSEGMEYTKGGPAGLWLGTAMKPGPGAPLVFTGMLKISASGAHPFLIYTAQNENQFSKSLLMWDEPFNGKNRVMSMEVSADVFEPTPRIVVNEISEANSFSHHPAGVQLKNGKILLAWTSKIGDGWPGVYFKIIIPESI